MNYIATSTLLTRLSQYEKRSAFSDLIKSVADRFIFLCVEEVNVFCSGSIYQSLRLMWLRWKLEKIIAKLCVIYVDDPVPKSIVLDYLNSLQGLDKLLMFR